MTIHSNYDHQCIKCGMHYIPYGEDIPCPKCGLIEEERFDFINLALKSLQFNWDSSRDSKKKSYMPDGWGSYLLGDYILFFIFELFDNFTKDKSGKSFDDFAKEFLFLKMGITETGVIMADHIQSIAIEIYKRKKSPEEKLNRFELLDL